MSNDSFVQYLSLCDDNKELRSNAPTLLATLNQAGRTALPELIKAYKAPHEIPKQCRADNLFAPDYGINLAHLDMQASVADAFHCGVPNLNSLLVVVANDVVNISDSLRESAPNGLTVCSLRNVPEKFQQRVADLLATHTSDNVATALNSLLLGDGVYIHIDSGVEIDKPVQVVNIFHADIPMLTPRRVIIDADANSKIRVLLCDHSQSPDTAHLSSEVIQVHTADGAHVELYDIEETASKTNRRWQLYTHQASNSHLTISTTYLRGGVSSNEYKLNLDGDGAEINVAGLAICADSQCVCNNVTLRHRCEHGSSRQLFKYAVYDQAHGAFGGRVVVEEGARFTDAVQNNRNLLASKEAKMDTAPQLEIYCDDVKAGHGATTGQLDERALFYMQSRGIPYDEAQRMLTQAFMTDVVDSISYEVLRQRLHILVEKRLAGSAADCGSCSISCGKNQDL